MKAMERKTVKSSNLFPDTPGGDRSAIPPTLSALIETSRDTMYGADDERATLSWKDLLEENLDKAVFEDRPLRTSMERRASANAIGDSGSRSVASLMRRNSYSVARETVSNDIDDPLKKLMEDALEAAAKQQEDVLPDVLALTAADEYKIITAITDAAKKITTGTIMSIHIDFSPTGSLRLGVKDLHGGILVVSVLKRTEGKPGPAESSGICLGDIIVGVNFQLCRDGSKSLSEIMKRLQQRGETSISMQIWRPHKLNASVSNAEFFPKVDDMFIQAHTMFRTKILTNWERSNFLENLLRYMEKESALAKKINVLKQQESSVSDQHQQLIKLMKQRRAFDNDILDLERNIFQAKGLRSALSVRIVHTKLVPGDNGEKVVVYVLRVEDIDSGLQWTVQWRYRDFFRLYLELGEMCFMVKDLPFPKKRFVGNSYVVEERIVAIEQYLRCAVSMLTSDAVADISSSRALRHLQGFLGVSRYLDCLHPPKMDDQRCLELMAYKHLNEPTSPSCQYVRRFVSTVNLDSKVGPGPLGYKPVLEFVFDALSEVEQFTLQNHGQTLTQVIRDRRSDLTEDQIKSFVRRCVRRQVESAVFLPLRRTLLRIVYSFISVRAEKLNKAMESLRHASPKYFYIDECASRCKSLPVAAKAFRDLVQAYLPADQGQYLIKAAITVMVVQAECVSLANGIASAVRSKTNDEDKSAADSGSPPSPPPPAPASVAISDDIPKPEAASPSRQESVAGAQMNKKFLLRPAEDLASQLLMTNLEGAGVQKSDLNAIDVNQLKMRVMNEEIESPPSSSEVVMLDSGHSITDAQSAVLQNKGDGEAAQQGGWRSFFSGLGNRSDAEGGSSGGADADAKSGAVDADAEDDGPGDDADHSFSDPVDLRINSSEAMNISQLDFEHSTTGAFIAGEQLAVDAAQVAEVDAVRKARATAAAAAAAAARARFGSQTAKELEPSLASSPGSAGSDRVPDASAVGAGGAASTASVEGSRGSGAGGKKNEGFYDVSLIKCLIYIYIPVI